MENGIHDWTTGRSYPLTSREGLADPEINALLEKHHHKSELSCLCGAHIGSFNKLIPVYLRRPKSPFTLSREDIDEHGPECFLRRDSDDGEAQHLRASTIFRPPKNAGGHGHCSHSTENSERVQYETFSGYARRVFSGGLSDAYIHANRGRSLHINPRPEEVFAAIDAQIKNRLFTNGFDGYVGANQSAGPLRFGLVFDPVVLDGEPCKSVNVYWWRRDGSYGLGLVGVRQEAIDPAVASLRTMTHHRAPPYFVLAVQDEAGVLQRIFFHQVAVAETFLVPCDSGAEAKYSVTAISNGAALIKPVRLDDFQRVLEAFDIRFLDGSAWRYRPDFLILWPSAGNMTLQIRELRGFADGKNERYDRYLLNKADYYSAAMFSVKHAYQVKDGTKLLWRPETAGPESWNSAAVRLEAPSDDLFSPVSDQD